MLPLPVRQMEGGAEGGREEKGPNGRGTGLWSPQLMGV
jgi:hypothetical protein